MSARVPRRGLAAGPEPRAAVERHWARWRRRRRPPSGGRHPNRPGIYIAAAGAVVVLDPVLLRALAGRGAGDPVVLRREEGHPVQVEPWLPVMPPPSQRDA